MESFDESLKYLLHEEPADFLRFAFADPTLTLVEPCETGLPSRNRDIDGSYVVVRNGVKIIAHVEFHRRHQNMVELAIDVAEAQIRLYRRERCPVVSHVWDLYGNRRRSLMKPHKLDVGPGSQSTYLRINLRAMKWQDLLAQGPPTLWPLVPIAKDGATGTAVKAARDAITAHGDQNSSRHADHLAILWFVAEAEDVPTKIIRSYIEEAQLMESTLYKSIFAKGREQGWSQGRSEGRSQGLSEGRSQGLSEGRSQGRTQADARTIHKLLVRWLGSVDLSVRDQIASFPDHDLVTAWLDEALEANDANSARKLLDKILASTNVPKSNNGSSRNG
ncbi:MAG TPA: hypothetical protein PK156_22715 [Polyangium sp.]|nr:hypothetical protein [Polyangium sp.]